MKFNNTLTQALSYVTAVGVIVMLVHVVAHAVSRQFFNTPFYGTNEIVSFWYLPIIALLGIPAAQLKDEHITVTVLTQRLGTAGQNVLAGFTAIVGAALSVGFAWYGFKKALEYTQQRSTAGVTDIVTWPVYYLVPIVFALLAVLYIAGFVSRISQNGAPVADDTAVPSTSATSSEHGGKDDQ